MKVGFWPRSANSSTSDKFWHMCHNHVVLHLCFETYRVVTLSVAVLNFLSTPIMHFYNIYAFSFVTMCSQAFFRGINVWHVRLAHAKMLDTCHNGRQNEKFACSLISVYPGNFRSSAMLFKKLSMRLKFVFLFAVAMEELYRLCDLTIHSLLSHILCFSVFLMVMYIGTCHSSMWTCENVVPWRGTKLCHKPHFDVYVRIFHSLCSSKRL